MDLLRYASLFDGLVRHLVLYPLPAATSSSSSSSSSSNNNASSSSSSLLAMLIDNNDDYENINQQQQRPFLLRYLPVRILLFLFWPILLTLIAASILALAWLFWLCIGAAYLFGYTATTIYSMCKYRLDRLYAKWRNETTWR
jgi:hypothetical protein